MKRAVAISFCAALLVANVGSVISAEPVIVLDRGLLHINTSDATWRYSADGNPESLGEILTGIHEDRVYVDDNDIQWPYRVAVFRYNGSIVLEGTLSVSFYGQPAISIISVNGDIEIATRLILDGYISLASEIGSIGGYGVSLGPGGGGVKKNPSPPDEAPGGAGHGGKGGGAFFVMKGVYDPSTGGVIFRDVTYGYPYLIGDGYHLVGGSAGAVAEYDPKVLILANPKGGGALEMTAKGKITIGGRISANGQLGIPYDTAFISQYTVAPCAGGGSGGLIRLRAHQIEIKRSAYLSVKGGNGAQNTDTDVYCGGGGAGGIIEFHIADRLHGYLDSDHILLDGGKGTAAGGVGRLEITTSNDTGTDDCGCNTTSGVTVTTDEPVIACPTIHAPPSACDCSKSVTGTGVTPPDVTRVNQVTRDIVTSATEATYLTPDAAVQILQGELEELANLQGNSSLEGAVDLMKAAESLGLQLGKQLAEGRQVGEVVAVTAATETIGMQVVVDDASSFQGIVFPDSTVDSALTDANWEQPYLSVKLIDFIPEGTSGDIIVVNILYANISDSLVAAPSADGTTIVNSCVIGTTVSLSSNITTDIDNIVWMTAEKRQTNLSGRTRCVYWEFQTIDSAHGNWSSNGCRLHLENESHVICVCDHLTNFAVLLKPDHVILSSTDEFALGIMSYIGLSMSLCSLVLSFIVIAVSLKSLKNVQSAMIHLNLIASLGIANFMFLIGADATENMMWCSAVAIILHYFYLCSFLWMLCEGLYIYIRVTNVFANVSGHLKFYFLASWGVPILIVGVTAGMNPEGYGTETACWLDTAGNMLWAFAGPIILIITANIFFLVMILYTFLTVKSIAKKSKYEQLKKSTRAVLVLLPLLGTTWIFGLVAFGSGSVVFFYIFVILNSLQGVFICIFHCLTNDDVASTMRIKLRKSRTKIDIFLTSTDRKSQQKVKSAETVESQDKEGPMRAMKALDRKSLCVDGASSSQWAVPTSSTDQITPQEEHHSS